MPNAQLLPSPAPNETEAPKHRSRKWVWGVIVLVIAIILFVVFRSKPAPTPPPRPVPVSTAVATLGDMNINLTGIGTVTPIDSVTVRSRVDGQLMRLHFKEGQFVKAGELLAEIDPRPYRVQLMQAEGQRAKDEAADKNAKMDLARYQNLYAQGILSKQQLDAQISTVNQGVATLRADQAQVESAKLNLVYCRITAPLSGRVGLRLVDPGNMVHASDASGLVVVVLPTFWTVN